MHSSNQHLLRIRGLTKRFLGNKVLDDVDFSVRTGEIHALVGENGAGKSTLIKILAGIYSIEEGEITIDDRAYRPHSMPAEISFVHQDLGLVDSLSVAENVALIAGFPRRNRLIDWRAVKRQAAELYASMGLAAPPLDQAVHGLSAASKSILAIVRGLANDARFIVLDEPTATLPDPDVRHLLTTLQSLAASGTGIIYVSHRLNEIFEMADQITVLRDGCWIETTPTRETTSEKVVAAMLGRAEASAADPRPVRESVRESRPSACLLSVADLVVGEAGPISFDLYQGEVIGLVGLQGAGHEAIARAIAGVVNASTGQISHGQQTLRHRASIGARIRKGIVFLSGDRLGESTFPGMSLAENLFPSPHVMGRNTLAYLKPDDETRRTAGIVDQLDVRPPMPSALIDWLSGGNQQKVCIGRWITSDAQILILEEPTAGVDIGARAAIHELIRQSVDQGKAAIIISSDFQEVASVCDRAIVIVGGRESARLVDQDLTASRLTSAASANASTIAAEV